MAKMRTVTEYRLLIQRTGNSRKDWRTRSLKSLANRIGLLTSPEPWRFYGSRDERERDGDELACCRGEACGCGGLTVREQALAPRENLPQIESLYVEKRQITTTTWEPCELSASLRGKAERTER